MGAALDAPLPQYGSHVLYDGQQMFKGQQDQRLRKMLKLGKSNIKYLASGKQMQAPGEQGFQGQPSQGGHSQALYSRADVLSNLPGGQGQVKSGQPAETHE